MANSVERGPADNPLSIVPLGGLGEFGLNMMTYHCGDDFLVVDTGLMFPGPEQPGVNLVLPDTTYLEEHRGALKGIILTHAHEDHIGSLPYVLRDFEAPVYGTRLTLGMVRRRLGEHGLLDRVELREVAPGESFNVGGFGAELVHVTHSLADAVAVVLDTPAGKVLHTGDFKVDEAPPVGPPIDLKRLAELGDEGIVCMLSDSTNAEIPGHTGAENSVTEAFEDIIENAPGRVLLSCFTSSTHRVQVAIDVAARLGRKVTLVGRSMVENTNIAIDLGYIRVPQGVLFPLEDLDKLPRRKQLVVTAGSQGEALSALSQIANDTHRYVSIEPGDRVILSSRVIPGNARLVNLVVNRLYRLGADVFQPDNAPVHVSGHGSADDLAMVLRLVRPASFVPIHGEWRQLFHHAKIARENGVASDGVFLAEDGDVLRFDGDGPAIVDHFDTVARLLDSSGLGLVDDCIIRERRRLSATGVIVPVLSLDPGGRPVVSDILTRGFIDTDDSEALLSEAHDVMLASLEELTTEEAESESGIENHVEARLKRFFRKKGIRRPVILPVVMELPEE